MEIPGDLTATRIIQLHIFWSLHLDFSGDSASLPLLELRACVLKEASLNISHSESLKLQSQWNVYVCASEFPLSRFWYTETPLMGEVGMKQAK